MSRRTCLLSLSIVCIPLIAPFAPNHQTAIADLFSMPAGLRSLEFVTVAEPGNPADENGLGAVHDSFQIAKFEVTTAQWVEFLNAKGKSEADGGLWNNDMDSTRSGPGPRCQIRREGTLGNYRYEVPPDFANRPVAHVSFGDACRFCNWLHNGQGDGSTEDGAYTLNGYRGTDGRHIQRNPDAKYFVPTEDEWYKAAYFDPRKPGVNRYWRYPTRSDQKPNRDHLTENSANFYDGGYLDEAHFYSEVGRFAKSAGPFGTFDQAGNVFEWTEGLEPPFLRIVRGGSFGSADGGLNVRGPNTHLSSQSDDGLVGIRIAASLPDENSGTAITHTVPKSSLPIPRHGGITSETTVAAFPRRPSLDPNSGKPFFPLAWFTWGSDEADLKQMAQEGVNLVLYVEAPSDLDDDEELKANLPRMKKYLDDAQKVGIKVLPQIGGWKDAYIRRDESEIARQRTWIEGVSNHPALFGYQLYDEPEYGASATLGEEGRARLREWVEAFGKLRTSIREWDLNPRHSLQVVFNLVPLSSWTEYLSVIDAFQIDRYPCDAGQAYFGHRGDWGPLMMAWSIAHGAQAMATHSHLHNPAPCMQGVGMSHVEGGQKSVWRNPLYEETRYMAYSSLTTGGWGVFHWIRNASCPEIRQNVARLYAELRILIPALEGSYVREPPLFVRHNHEGITRTFLTDSVADITTLAVEDEANYYVIACDNSGVFNDVILQLQLPHLKDQQTRTARVLHEDWEREIRYNKETNGWEIDQHTMVFGDTNIWVISKSAPAADP